MERWAGRAALVTGASSGIGRAIVLDLLQNGVNVVGCARRVEAIEALRYLVPQQKRGGSDSGRLLALRCDLSKQGDILNMFSTIRNSEFRGVDICINNAGIGSIGSLAEERTEDWQKMVDVNVLALSVCTREALRSMRSRGVNEGHIIHVSSILGHYVSRTNAFYSATKFAVRALAEGLRKELMVDNSGIKITQISPALVRTEIFAAAGNVGAEEKISAWSGYLEPYDVSQAVLFVLATPRHVQVEDIVIRPILIKEKGEKAMKSRL